MAKIGILAILGKLAFSQFWWVGQAQNFGGWEARFDSPGPGFGRPRPDLAGSLLERGQNTGFTGAFSVNFTDFVSLETSKSWKSTARLLRMCQNARKRFWI